MIVGLVNIGIGNLHSITKFLDHKDTKYILINNEKEFEKCDKIIIPGQGAFNFSIKQIENSFLKDSITNHIFKKKYILGICLGMQLFMEKSFENEISNGLGLIKGNVIKINMNSKIKPIPHMGWNKIFSHSSSNVNKLFQNVLENNYFYFAHSYFCDLKLNQHCMITNYENLEFTSFYFKENIIGTQFHPELSGENGYKFLKCFLKL